MGKYKNFWILLLILIIATFLRLYQLKTIPPGLYPDEAMNGNNALEALRTGDFKVFYPENNGREGLLINIQALFLKFFGVNEPWVLRLPSAIFGILTVLGIYFLGKELFSEDYEIRNQYESTKTNDSLSYIRKKFVFRSEAIGLLAAFFLATSFWHINFSRIGFRAIMAPFFLVWSVFFLLKAFRSRHSTFYVLLSTFSGILFGLGFYTYIAYRVMPLLIFAVIFYYWRKSRREGSQKKLLLSIFYFLFSAFIVALPIGIYFLKQPADFLGRTSQISIFSSQTPFKDLGLNILKTVGMFNVRGDWNWRHNYSGRPELFWPVGILFLLGVWLCVSYLWKSFRLRAAMRPSGHGFFALAEKSGTESPAKSRAGTFSGSANENFSILLLFVWFILATIPVVVSNESLPHALRSILTVPPVFILAALGGIKLYAFLKKYVRQYWLIPATIVFLSLLVFEAYNTYFVLWANNQNTADAFNADYVRIAEEINQLPKELPKYVIVEANGVPVRGIPMPAQTVMFITDTYSPENQNAKNIHYILPGQENEIPRGALVFHLR